MSASSLARVVVAISAFRSDAPVLALLTRIFAEGESGFAAVIVVDSLSDGALERRIRAAGWPVIYENSSINLGSAGNLARRLQLAATMDADWCFAINHDGTFDRAIIAALAAKAASENKVGAVYPKRVLLDRANSSFKPITSFFSTVSHASEGEEGDDTQVAWDSSNGALYGLAPVRAGVTLSVDLWHGWEDLSYGLELGQAGWRSFRLASAAFVDDYEYQRVNFLGRELFITRKPAWLAYYVIRNLVLIVRRSKAGVAGWKFIAIRLSREVAFTLLFRTQKLLRLRNLFVGLWDGLAGVSGQRDQRTGF